MHLIRVALSQIGCDEATQYPRRMMLMPLVVLKALMCGPKADHQVYIGSNGEWKAGILPGEKTKLIV